MKYSKILVFCLSAAAFAFAQYPWETLSSETSNSDSSSSEEASSSSSSESSISYFPTPAPAPVSVLPSSSAAAEPAPAAGKTIFDNLRGYAYNPYSTQGAASTVGDLVLLPSDIYGQKFFYVSPTAFAGYTAFGLGGGSALLGLDNSQTGNLAALILGYANPAFGVALNYSVSKSWESSKDPKYSSRTTNPGDNIGFYFSMPLGFATLYANADWLTYAESYFNDDDDYEDKEDFSTIEAKVGLNGKSGSLNYDGYLNAIRIGGTQINDEGDKYIDNYTYSGFALGFDLGYAVLQNSTARVIVGLNNAVGIVFLDKIDDLKADNIIGVVISPNILAEVSLFDNWLAFAGAAHSLDLMAGNGDRIKDTSFLSIMHSYGTDTFAGIRYQKTTWAFEAQVSADVFNNPFGGFNGSNVFAGFGGFIYF